MRKPKAKIRIRLVAGQWYAFGTGLKRVRNLMLVPAINFCAKLNKAEGRYD